MNSQPSVVRCPLWRVQAAVGFNNDRLSMQKGLKPVCIFDMASEFRLLNAFFS